MSHLRSVLGVNPEQQGLSLPWSEDEAIPDEPESLQVNDMPCEWMGSPDPASHIQFGKFYLHHFYYLYQSQVRDDMGGIFGHVLSLVRLKFSHVPV